MKKLSLFCILLGFALTILGLLYFVSDKFFLSSAKSTTGSIAYIHSELISNPQFKFLPYTPKEFAEVLFKDNAGKFVKTKIELPNINLKNGDNVEILYNPNSPNNVKIASIFSPSKNLLIAFLGTILFFIGFYLRKRSNRIYFTR